MGLDGKLSIQGKVRYPEPCRERKCGRRKGAEGEVSGRGEEGKVQGACISFLEIQLSKYEGEGNNRRKKKRKGQ